MKQKTKNAYSGSMVVFYIVCRYGWKRYLKYWESFTELSDNYTQAFGEAALKAIDSAQAMPDASQRRGNVSQQGSKVDESSKSALLCWKKLRRFIVKAFPGTENRAAAIAQAGGTHYAKAGKGSLTEITQLLIAGQIYLQENSELLLSKGKMPATFTADYNKAKDVYDEEHLGYGAAKGDATDGTANKVTTNNALYAGLQEMFGDAQIIFEAEKTVAKQFSYEAVKRLVTKDLSGIHFLVINPLTNKPLTTALITNDADENTMPVNKLGVLDLKMKVGVHSITVTSPGFSTYHGVVKVDAGVMHRVKIELAKAEMVNTGKSEVSIGD